MFHPKRFALSPIVPLPTKGILFSVSSLSLDELVAVLGPPQESDGPHSQHAKFWMLRIDGILIGLEYSAETLAVFSESADADLIAGKLGFSTDTLTRYQFTDNSH
ncbi:MAG: hypothetical protein QM817_36220 [Archangium sp.]